MWQRIIEPLGLTEMTYPTVDPYLRGPHAKGYVRPSPEAPYIETYGTGNVAYGHAGAVVGFSTIAMRTESGRGIVLWHNALDLHNPLSSTTPFLQAALAG